MKSKLFSLSTVLLLAMSALQSACQTTSLSARTPRTLTSTEKSEAAVCARMEDRRSGCEDAVGCYWDYDASSCLSH